MTVPFLNLARLHGSVEDELFTAFKETLANSAFHGGDALVAFEREFAAAHGQTDAVGCGSGTDALALTMRALGLGPGDEVVLPCNTFIATAEAVVHTGATPVLADVDPVSLLITPETVAPVLSERTRAVVPVHLYGHVLPFAHLREWKQRGLFVIEDAAQAHLGTDEGSFVGSVGDAACFSFYPGKNLGALGDGGMVLSTDDSLLARVRKARDHGRVDKYVHDEIGFCSRLDGLQAAFLRVKLGHLVVWTEGRRRVADRYRHHLASIESTMTALVPWRPGDVHHLLVLRTPAEGRRSLIDGLSAAGIGTGIHYPVPLSRQPAMTRWSRDTPVAEAVATEILSLPIDPLMDDADVDEVCRVIAEWTRGRG